MVLRTSFRNRTEDQVLVCGKNDADAEEKLQALKQDLLKAAE